MQRDERTMANEQRERGAEVERRVGVCGLGRGRAECLAGERALDEACRSGIDRQHEHVQAVAQHERLLRMIDRQRRDLAFALVCGPQRHDRIRRFDRLQRGVPLEAQVGQRFGGGKRLRERVLGHRLGIGRMAGLLARELQARDIGQVGQARRGREACDEAREGIAVEREDARARRVPAHELSGHGAEEGFADELLRDREAVGERIDQRTHDVVAVHREAPGRIGAVPRAQPRRAGQIGVEQGLGKAGLAAAAGHEHQAHASALSSARAGRSAAAASTASARPASASSVANDGTPPSRSSSVGAAPRRSITPA